MCYAVVVCVMLFKSRGGKRDNGLLPSEEHSYDHVETRCGPIYITPVKNAPMNEADAETPPHQSMQIVLWQKLKEMGREYQLLVVFLLRFL